MITMGDIEKGRIPLKVAVWANPDWIIEIAVAIPDQATKIAELVPDQAINIAVAIPGQAAKIKQLFKLQD